MVNSKLNILIACGSGVATSAIAAEQVELILKEKGITNYNISKISMQEIQSQAPHADIVLTTNNYKGDLGKPHMSLMGFVTGIREEALKKELGNKLVEINENKGR